MAPSSAPSSPASGSSRANEDQSALGFREFWGGIASSQLSAALVLTALLTKKTTRISRLYQIERSFEHIAEKLLILGAKVQRVRDFRLLYSYSDDINRQCSQYDSALKLRKDSRTWPSGPEEQRRSTLGKRSLSISKILKTPTLQRSAWHGLQKFIQPKM